MNELNLRIRRSNQRPRLASYPLVSGDSFALLANCYPLGFGKIPPDEIFDEHKQIWFVEVSSLEGEEHLKREKLLQLSQQHGHKKVLLIHNGDLLLDQDFLDQLSQNFIKIYAVNIVSEKVNIEPLPIGLENLWLNSNRELTDFIYYEKTRSTLTFETQERHIPIFASFNETTNLSLRQPLIEKLRSLNINNRNGLTRENYRSLLRQSLFVLSPPGNGFDCHRTWEALYCGAVPVVLNGYLSRLFTETLPIKSVDNWDEILDLNSEELEIEYRKLMSRQRSMLLMDYWIKKIHNDLDLYDE